MAQDVTHFVRWRPQLGVWMQTRCGVHVTRASMQNRALFKTKGGLECHAVGLGGREPTCRVCRKRLGLEYRRGFYEPDAKPGLPKKINIVTNGVLINGT